jgi:hypothetical protein
MKKQDMRQAARDSGRRTIGQALGDRAVRWIDGTVAGDAAAATRDAERAANGDEPSKWRKAWDAAQAFGRHAVRGTAKSWGQTFDPGEEWTWEDFETPEDRTRPIETPDPVTEPVAEPVTEPVAEPVTEPVPDPVDEPVSEPVTEPVTDPVTDPEEDTPRGPRRVDGWIVREPKAEPVPVPALPASPVGDRPALGAGAPAGETPTRPTEATQDDPGDSQPAKPLFPPPMGGGGWQPPAIEPVPVVPPQRQVPIAVLMPVFVAPLGASARPEPVYAEGVRTDQRPLPAALPPVPVAAPGNTDVVLDAEVVETPAVNAGGGGGAMVPVTEAQQAIEVLKGSVKAMGEVAVRAGSGETLTPEESADYMGDVVKAIVLLGETFKNHFVSAHDNKLAKRLKNEIAEMIGGFDGFEALARTVHAKYVRQIEVANLAVEADAVDEESYLGRGRSASEG